MKLYTIMKDSQVAWVTSNSRYADIQLGRGLSYIKHSCDSIDGYEPICYVVTVPAKSGSRIIKVTSDQQVAHRLASSVQAKVRKFQVTNGPGCNEQRISFYKYFVVTDPGPGYCDECEEYSCGCVEGERVTGRGSFGRTHRTADVDDFRQHPFITRRRRYSDDLPERWEVAGVDRREARKVANWWDSMNSSYPTLEYNVDYKIITVNGSYEIEPKLLENLDTEAIV